MSDVVRSAGRVARSPAFKFFLIAFLILLLLIPLLIVGGLVSEREGRSRAVMSEVSNTWGGVQQLSGPFLVVPYMVRIETREGDKVIQQTQERRAVFLPEALNITGSAKSNVLHRSIFDVNVYTSELTLDGSFPVPDIADVDPNAISVRWREATFVLGLSDVSGLKETATLTVNDQEKLPFSPSVGLPGIYMNGMHTKLSAATSAIEGEAPTKAFKFHSRLVFSGSGAMTFSPSARETQVAMTSDWPHPSFTGSFLPIDRDVKTDGFSAKWRVPHLARSVPNAWMLSDGGLDRFSQHQFGVTFYQPVDFYDLVMRAVKYGVLFLAVGFMGVFVLELLSDKRVHAVQYLFVGIAMVFFYVLLLSFAEHIGFTKAYIVASAATGGMLATYVAKALDSARSGLMMASLFTLLYGFLFLILQLEDYALLAGAVLGFLALTATMFATLKIDWSGLHGPDQEEAPASV